jgi:hypothetical protein
VSPRARLIPEAIRAHKAPCGTRARRPPFLQSPRRAPQRCASRGWHGARSIRQLAWRPAGELYREDDGMRYLLAWLLGVPGGLILIWMLVNAAR